MASWADTFKSYLNTNTMKNPLDTLLPKIGINRPNHDKPPIIKPSPIKAKANEEVKALGDSLSKYLPLIVVVVLVFALGGKK
jgi:hypothetical protein